MAESEGATGTEGGETEDNPESTAGETDAPVEEDTKESASVKADEGATETATEGGETTEGEVTEKEEDGKGETDEKPAGGAVMGQIDDETLIQLEQTEKEANEVAEIVRELKLRLADLLQKDQMSSEESEELKEKNLELRKQMEIFEEKTKLLRDLIINLDILKSMKSRIPQAKHEEDILPRVILCGIEEEYVPKIVVCHQKNKTRCASAREGSTAPGTSDLLEPCSSKPCTSAPQNDDLEKLKSMLEEDISNKDKVLEELHAKLASLQNEIKLVTKENNNLHEKIQNIQKTQKQNQPKKMCPIMMAAKLQEYSNYTRQLEQQLVDMDQDFRTVVKDICAVQKQRNCHKQDTNVAEKTYSCSKPC